MKTANFPLSAVLGTTFPFELGKNDWLISIIDAGSLMSHIVLPFDDVLFLKFNDVETENPLGNACTMDDAKLMAAFIRQARVHKKNVWVHCHAGQRRSGGVVKALCRLGWEYAENHVSPSMVGGVNRRVYEMLVLQFPELRNAR